MYDNSPTIRTSGLTKRYGSTLALDDLDLAVEHGEVFGLLGPNGAGKSTLIALLLGLLHPTAGSATVLGLDVGADAAALHRRLAYVPSVAELWPGLTGEETLQLLGNLHGDVDLAYRDVLVDRFELDVHKKNRAYSHGNRQKVVLIAGFATRADLLMLDEPTTGLDPLMGQVFQACVREARDRGQTVLLSSHILSEVEATCDRVGMLRAGRLVDVGSLASLRHLSSVHLRATVRGPLPDLSALPGVTNVEVRGPGAPRHDGDGGDDGGAIGGEAGGTRVDCDVTGDIGPLVDALAGAGVTWLTTREPSLEELFLRHYGGSS